MLEKLVESTEAMFGWSSDSTLGTLGGKQHRQCHLQLTPEDSFIGKSSSTSGLEQLHDETLRRWGNRLAQVFFCYKCSIWTWDKPRIFIGEMDAANSSASILLGTPMVWTCLNTWSCLQEANSVTISVFLIPRHHLILRSNPVVIVWAGLRQQSLAWNARWRWDLLSDGCSHHKRSPQEMRHDMTAASWRGEGLGNPWDPRNDQSWRGPNKKTHKRGKTGDFGWDFCFPRLWWPKRVTSGPTFAQRYLAAACRCLICCILEHPNTFSCTRIHEHLFDELLSLVNFCPVLLRRRFSLGQFDFPAVRQRGCDSSPFDTWAERNIGTSSTAQGGGGSFKITLLRVIPTMTFVHFVAGKSSGILSDISSGILSGIVSGISSGILSTQIFWHSIWQTFWHFIWHTLWHSIWHKFW